MGDNRMWIPMMLFSGIMDMMFFTSMMSFMGWGMNPMESAMLGSDGGMVIQAVVANGRAFRARPGWNIRRIVTATLLEGQDYDNSGSSDSGGFDGFDGGGGFDSF